MSTPSVHTADCIHHDNRYSASLDAYVKNVATIWPQVQTRPVDLTLFRLISHASEACEEVRKNHWGNAAGKLGDVMVWWMTLVHQVQIDPTPANFRATVAYVPEKASEMVWQKMPGACVTCLTRWLTRERGVSLEASDAEISRHLQAAMEHFPVEKGRERQCICAGYKNEVENRAAGFKLFAKRAGQLLAAERAIPQSFADIAVMFNNIHHNNIRIYSTEETAFHLLEEVGEVTRAYSNLFYMDYSPDDPNDVLPDRQNLVLEFMEELADVFYWSLQLHAKLRDQVRTGKEIIKHVTRKTNMRSIDTAFEEWMEPAESLIAMIWALYETDHYLACEKCKKCPCNATEHRALLTEDAFQTDEVMFNTLRDGSVAAVAASRRPPSTGARLPRTPAGRRKGR